MKSLGTKIKQLAAMVGTKDLSAWESAFCDSVATQSQQGAITANLSEKQITVIDRLYGKHFGDA